MNTDIDDIVQLRKRARFAASHASCTGYRRREGSANDAYVIWMYCESCNRSHIEERDDVHAT